MGVDEIGRSRSALRWSADERGRGAPPSARRRLARLRAEDVAEAYAAMTTEGRAEDPGDRIGWAGDGRRMETGNWLRQRTIEHCDWR